MKGVKGDLLAEASFGQYQGQLFSLAQAVVAAPGVGRNTSFSGSIRGPMPTASHSAPFLSRGTIGQGIPGTGIEARFGPEGSPFAGKFYAVAAMNNTVYQATADAQCAPLVTFDPDRFGRMGITFSPDGQHMLVSTGTEQRGTIARVRPDGTLDVPLSQSDRLVSPTGMAFAPASFGAYGGELFVATLGNGGMQMTQAPAPDGQVYRVTPTGDVHLVASGLHNPVGVHFFGIDSGSATSTAILLPAAASCLRVSWSNSSRVRERRACRSWPGLPVWISAMG